MKLVSAEGRLPSQRETTTRWWSGVPCISNMVSSGGALHHFRIIECGFRDHERLPSLLSGFRGTRTTGSSGYVPARV